MDESNARPAGRHAPDPPENTDSAPQPTQPGLHVSHAANRRTTSHAPNVRRGREEERSPGDRWHPGERNPTKGHTNARDGGRWRRVLTHLHPQATGVGMHVHRGEAGVDHAIEEPDRVQQHSFELKRIAAGAVRIEIGADQQRCRPSLPVAPTAKDGVRRGDVAQAAVMREGGRPLLPQPVGLVRTRTRHRRRWRPRRRCVGRARRLSRRVVRAVRCFLRCCVSTATAATAAGPPAVACLRLPFATIARRAAGRGWGGRTRPAHRGARRFVRASSWRPKFAAPLWNTAAQTTRCDSG